jgi:hypothetical protein
MFDDRNTNTVARWAYPNTGRWDPERNVSEFLKAMPAWRKSGLLAFTINLQGGSPEGYSKDQPWHNSGIEADGSLRADCLERLERILEKADDLGMVVILGYFYFGQEPRMAGEEAIMRGVDNATDWVLGKGYANVLIEISNECNVGAYKHEIIKPKRAHELIQRVQERSKGKVKNPAGRLLVSTSFGGGAIPVQNVVAAADFVLVHGNGVGKPDGIRTQVDKTRAVKSYHNQPVVFNEDDHFDFDKPDNNFLAALSQYAGWGYFDYRMKDEGFDEGYQSVPTSWGISSQRKKGFFGLLAEVTGSEGKR